MGAFEELRQEMAADDAIREKMIKRSRDVLKLAKTGIYCLHRKQWDLATQNLDEAQQIAVEELLPLAAEAPQLRNGGALGACLEEYCEGRVFQAYLRTGRIVTIHSEGLEGVVNRDEYLGGVLDTVGELTRTAVLDATKRDEAGVARALECVQDIHAALMGFDFRNGQLRRKYDAVKYSLKRLETITYELSLAKALGGFAMESRAVQEDGGSGGGDGDEGDDASTKPGNNSKDGHSKGRSSAGRGRGRPSPGPKRAKSDT